MFKKLIGPAFLLLTIPTTLFFYFVQSSNQGQIRQEVVKPIGREVSREPIKKSITFKARSNVPLRTGHDLKLFWQGHHDANGYIAGFARTPSAKKESKGLQVVQLSKNGYENYVVKNLGALAHWEKEIFALISQDVNPQQILFATIDRAGHFVIMSRVTLEQAILQVDAIGTWNERMLVSISLANSRKFYLYDLDSEGQTSLLSQLQTSFEAMGQFIMPFGEKSLVSIAQNEVRLHEFSNPSEGIWELTENKISTPEFLKPDLAISVPFEHQLAVVMHNQKQRSIQVIVFNENIVNRAECVDIDNDEKWDNLIYSTVAKKLILYKKKSQLYDDRLNVLTSSGPSDWVVEKSVASGYAIDRIVAVGDKTLSDDKFYPLAHSRNPIRALHVTLEYNESEVGGIAAVTKTLIPKLNEAKEDGYVKADVIMPKFSFLKIPKEALEKVSVVEHFYRKTWVKSAVWKTKGELFLVEPEDPAFEKIFQIADKSTMYTEDAGFLPIERWLYFNTAVAAFVSQYKDPLSHQPFHILHMHSYHVSVATELLELYAAARMKAGIEKPKTIIHLHGLSYDQGWIKGTLLEGLGLKAELEWENLTRRSLKIVDHAVTVSRNMYEDGMKEDEASSYGLSPLFRELASQNRLHPILNGISTSQWDPRNKSLMTPRGEDLSFSAQSIAEGKGKVKRFLMRQGCFSDDNRPLVTFVGRFSDEKGIELLEPAVQEVMKLGGNFAIMGSYGKSYNSREMILKLKEMAKTEFTGRLLILDTVELQKEDNLGMYVRAATDLSFVPSREETCGLVPLEFFGVGALTITSYVGGLKDTVIPYSKGREFFNGFSFDYNDTDQLYWSINEAFSVLRDAPKINPIRQKIMMDFHGFDWSTKGGAVSQIVKLYKQAVQI